MLLTNQSICQNRVSYGVDLRMTAGLQKCPVIASTAGVVAVFGEMAFLEEIIWVAGTVDQDLKLIHWSILGSGENPKMAPINVFEGAIMHQGHGIFVVRSAPKNSAPTIFDRRLIKKLSRAGVLLGYPLLDFVRIGKKSSGSLMPIVARRRIQVKSAQVRNTDEACIVLAEPPRTFI